jgi:hypothetical protein
VSDLGFSRNLTGACGGGPGEEEGREEENREEAEEVGERKKGERVGRGEGGG